MVHAPFRKLEKYAIGFFQDVNRLKKLLPKLTQDDKIDLKKVWNFAKRQTTKNYVFGKV